MSSLVVEKLKPSLASMNRLCVLAEFILDLAGWNEWEESGGSGQQREMEGGGGRERVGGGGQRERATTQRKRWPIEREVDG